MSSNDRVIIFDTTLRDGEQSPGASMTGEEKLRIAKALERLKVDVIEAGFAIASPGDFAAVKAIADTIKDSTVCSLSRALDADIDRAAEALKGANSGRIHTFIATSPMKEAGVGESAIEQVVWDNPVAFFGQSPNVDFSTIAERPGVDQTRLFEDNSVLRGQTPVSRR
jgi:hypothetical protein